MALVKSVRDSTPSCTSARRPFSHATGSVTSAPAATYQAHAASRSATLIARLAIPVTAMVPMVGGLVRCDAREGTRLARARSRADPTISLLLAVQIPDGGNR